MRAIPAASEFPLTCPVATPALRRMEALLVSGFIFYLFTMPLGSTFEELGAIVALCGLVGIHWLDHQGTGLRILPIKWLFVAFYAFLACNTVLSISIPQSWGVLHHNLHRGLVMPFVALEVGRRSRWLAWAILAMAAMSLLQGLDGLWQFHAGRDFLRGLPTIGGRLTGSFASYRVGDLMAMALAPCLALPQALHAVFPERWPRPPRWSLALLAPGVFLWVFAQSRSGYAALCVSVMGYYFLVRGFSWIKLGISGVAGGLLVAFGPKRVGLDEVLSDGRTQELWPLALKVFEHWPVLGSGLGTYRTAYQELGYQMHHPGNLDILHPHNLFLQFLAEGGIVGLAFLLAFLAVPLVWAWGHIRQGLRQGQDAAHWHMAAACWAAFLGYPFMGIGTAHEFMRTWWLGLAMALLGLTLGACLRCREPETRPG